MRYYVSVGDGKVQGPYELEWLRAAWLAGRKIPPTVMVCAEGSTEWIAATQVFGPSVPRADAPPSPPTGQSPPPLPPAASFERLPLQSTADPSTPQPGSIEVGRTFTLAFEGFKRHYGTLLLASLVSVGLVILLEIPGQLAQFLLRDDQSQVVGGFFACISLLLQVLVGWPLQASYPYLGCHAVDGTPRVGDLFVGFRRYGRALLSSLLMTLFAVGAAIGGAIPGGVLLGIGVGMRSEALTAIGTIALIIGVLATCTWIVVRMGMVPALAVDPRCRVYPVTELFSISMRATKAHGVNIFLVFLLGGLLMSATVLLLCVGLLFLGLPLWFCIFGALYRQVFRHMFTEPDPA